MIASEYLTVALISLLAAMSPGPDFILISRQSLFGSRKSGIYAAVGIALGLSIHCLYALVGLTTLMQQSSWIYECFKYLGAAYLAYLGIQLLRSWKTDPASFQEETLQKKAFSSGFFCNVLNPKASFFVLGLFSQFVDVSAPLLHHVTLGFEIVLITLLWFVALSIFLTYEPIQKNLSLFQKYVSLLMGIFLLGFSFKLAFL